MIATASRVDCLVWEGRLTSRCGRLLTAFGAGMGGGARTCLASVPEDGY